MSAIHAAPSRTLEIKSPHHFIDPGPPKAQPDAVDLMQMLADARFSSLFAKAVQSSR